MAVFSIIKLSELEGAKRFDAEYYKPEYLILLSQLKNLRDIILLKSISNEIVSGSYIDKYFDAGTLYLRVNNITESGFDLSDIKFVDIVYSKIPNKIRLKEQNLVLGRTGTIGVVHIVPKNLDGSVISQHITKIVLKPNIDRYYLVAYLNTKFARLQEQRVSLGSMQIELTLNGTRNLLIFYPKKGLLIQEVSDLIKKFYNFEEKSQSLYSQAENLLLEELGLKDFKPRYKKTYTAKLSSALSAHRIDAEYFQPAYEEVSKKIKEYPNGFSRLLKHIENVNPNFDPTKYQSRLFLMLN